VASSSVILEGYHQGRSVEQFPAGLYASLVTAPRTSTRVAARLRALWQLARREHATPREIGQAVAVGVFVGCTPAIGFHGWIAVGLATLLRLNRLWAFLGSRVCTFFILPWIALAEVQLAHRIRAGRWVALTVDTALHEAPGLLVDWLAGAVLVGGVLAALLGAAAYVVAGRCHSSTAPPVADLGPSRDRPSLLPRRPSTAPPPA
jgi:uncharacterized protein (DUF2062 family)